MHSRVTLRADEDRLSVPTESAAAGQPLAGEVDAITQEVCEAIGSRWALLFKDAGSADPVVLGRSKSAPEPAWTRQDGWMPERGEPAWFDHPDTREEVLVVRVSDAGEGDERFFAAGFDRDAAQSVRAIVPVLVAMLRAATASLFRLLRRAEAERRLRIGMREALDQSHLAVLVFDSDARVQFQNRAARALLADRDGIRVSGRTVVPTALSDAIQFQVTLEHMVERSRHAVPRSDPAARVMLLGRGAGKRPLVATLTQADHRATEPGAAAAILYLVKPEQDLTPLLASLCQLHKLSPAETRLVHELVGGHTLADAAKTMHVSEHTVRAYLKQVFAKTGTNRQTELVRLMLISLLPLPEAVLPATP